MARITGKRGELYLPTGKGNSLSNQALTVSASKEIQGTTYTNRFYGTSSRSAWNKSETITARLQGIVGEITISPGTANDTIDVTAGSYHKDTSGVQTSTAGTGVSVTRDADGAQWNMVTIDTGSGTVKVTAGLATASVTAYNDTWAASGGPAYIGTDEILVGVVRLTPGSAAVVTSAEIFYTLVDGATLAQERSDIPTFSILPMEGGVLLTEALLACKTAGARRTVYADYYDQYPLLAKVGDIEGWTLTGTSDTVELEALGDFAPEKDLSGAVSWSGTFTRFYVADERVWVNAMQRRTAGIIRLKPDSNNSTVYYEGAVIFSDWGTGAALGDGTKENVSFEGDGNLEFRGF